MAISLPIDSLRLQEQIDALPRIAAFATAGRLQLFTSPELDFELWEGPPDGMRRTSLSLFQGVELHRAPAPFNYTRVVASYLDRPADPTIPRPSDAKTRRRRFFATLNEPRFNELRRALGAKRAADAFHILTAERAGLSVFLTDDDSLLKRVARIKVDLEVRVLPAPEGPRWPSIEARRCAWPSPAPGAPRPTSSGRGTGRCP